MILAGGRGERMGGQDKGLLEIGGQPILARILAVLRPDVPDVLLSANGRPGRFAAFGCPVVPDPPGLVGQGPLAGLAAAAAARPGRRIVSLPCDTPFLPPGIAAALLAEAAGRPVFVRCAGKAHPTLAAYPAGALDGLPAWLASSGRRALAAWLDHLGARPLDWPGEGAEACFLNVNRPIDLTAARRKGGP